MPNDLTLHAPTFITTAIWGKGLTGAYAVAPVIATTGGDTWTIEARFGLALGDTTVRVLAGNTTNFFIYSDASGRIAVSYGTGGTVVGLSTSTQVNDGQPHHVALVFAPGGSKLFCDGVQVASSATTYTASNPGAVAGISLLAFENGGFGWLGYVDEVAVWSTARYSGAFVVPTAPYSGIESGLLALWHLDNNGLDSVGSLSPPTVANLDVTASGVGSVSLSVPVAGGTLPLSYAWYLSTTPGTAAGGGTLLAGKTQPTLTLVATDLPGGVWGYVRCKVTDADARTATTYERPVRLAVSPPAFRAYPTYFGGRTSLDLVVIGDSTSVRAVFNNNVSVADRVKSLIEANTPLAVTVANYAVGGLTTGNWLPGQAAMNAVDAAGSLAGKFVLVRLSTNDAQAHVAAATVGSNLSTIVAHLLGLGAAGVFMSWPIYREAGSHFPSDASVTFDESATPYLLAYQGQIDGLVNGTTILAGDRNGYAATAMFAPTLLYDRIHENVAGADSMARYEADAVLAAIAVAPPTPSVPNHRYSFAALKTAAKQAMGGSASQNLDVADVINDALAWLCDYHEWSWLRRPLLLDLTANQPYVLLPADFKSLGSLKRAGSIFGDPRPTTIDRLLNMRVSTGGVSPSSLYYAVGIGEQATVSDEPRYRLELYPTPGATVANALFGVYDRVTPRLVEDASLPDIPALWHPALKMVVRAQAKFQQFDSTEPDWQLASTALDKLMLVDGRNQPSLGQSVGAVGMMRGEGESYHLRGTIVQP